MKKKASPFDKFYKKKSNAAIKEQFRQEKKKVKKEREEYFDKKRAELRIQNADPLQKQSQPAISRPQSTELMPLNKYISHAGVSGRREAAEIVKKGIVKVNGKIVTEPGHKISPKDEVVVNGKKILFTSYLINQKILLQQPTIRREERQCLILSAAPQMKEFILLED